MQRICRWILLIGLLGVITGCAYPQDPEGATDEVLTSGTLLVGLVENAPWVEHSGDEPSGVEVELVRRYAEELGVEVEWIRGSTDEHMEALKQHQLHMTIGGITQATPWRREVALTIPYFTSRFTVGVPDGTMQLDTIDGMAVAVKRGTVLAAYVADKNGIPVAQADPFQSDGPVAAEDWELEEHGYTPGGITLHTQKYVMAVPPGENRWLMRLEQFLQEFEPFDIAQQLREEQS